MSLADVHVKICGLTRRADVAAAVEHGVWAVGFVVWPGSPRAVPMSGLRDLLAEVPDDVRRVAVVVDAVRDDLLRLRDQGITTVQLHGSEDAAAHLDLGMDVIKATSLTDDNEVEQASALPPMVTVLVDAHDPVRKGGTGERADWTRAAALSLKRPVILAGGLNSENVGDAVRAVSPWGIDVSSGVETTPGIKDAAKMARLFAAVKSGSREAGHW